MNQKDEFREAFLKGDWQKMMGMDVASQPDRTVFRLAPNERIYIQAREHRHAEYWAKKQRLHKTQWKYVSEPNDLMGARGIVIYYSTWHSHSRANELDEAVSHCVASGRLVRLEGIVDV